MRARVTKEEGSPLSCLARASEGLADSVWLRGPKRLKLLARRPLAQGGLRLSARERNRSSKPAYHLAARERGLKALLPPDSRSNRRALPERARQRRRSGEGASGLRRN